MPTFCRNFISDSFFTSAAVLLLCLSGCNIPKKDYPLTPKTFTTCVLTGYNLTDSSGKHHAGAVLTYDSEGRVTGFVALDSAGKPSATDGFTVLYGLSGRPTVKTGTGTYADSVIFTSNNSGLVGQAVERLPDGGQTTTKFYYDRLNRLIRKVQRHPDSNIDSIFQIYATNLNRPTYKVLYHKNQNGGYFLTEYHRYAYNSEGNLVADSLAELPAADPPKFYQIRSQVFDATRPPISNTAFVHSEDPNYGSLDRDTRLITATTQFAKLYCDGSPAPEPQELTTELYDWRHFNINSLPDSVYVTVGNNCTGKFVTYKATLTYNCTQTTK